MANPVSFFVTLFDPDKGFFRSWVFGILFSILPGILISIIVNALLESTDTSLALTNLRSALFQYGIVAPVLETILMWLVLYILMKVSNANQIFSVLASTLIWSLFHAAFSLTWGITIAWSFFIFSVVFLTWQPRSTLKALLLVSIIHGSQNTLAVLFTYYF